MTALSIIDSVSHALTGVAYTFRPDEGLADPNPENNPKPWLVRVWSNRIFHVSTTGAATATDLPVADQFNGMILSVPPGGTISVLKMAGEPDGTVWFSHVKRV